jgi:hypothetical protein
METLPLEKTEKETLRQWLRGNMIKDTEGNLINHRIWFKNILNPFLRKMGRVIVSKFTDDNQLLGYEIRKYPLTKV